ncbi:MAG: hypothetical protein J0H93_07375 [Chlamydiales bacterium]|nr:hypothetical protein [Chlamydiales bacterium]
MRFLFIHWSTMLKFILCVLTLAFCFGNTNIYANTDVAVSSLVLKGYLGKEQLSESRKIVSEQSWGPDRSLILEINSTSGDLLQVLDFAKFLYEHQRQYPHKIIVYIQDSAVGPAAILPFLANELYISLLASWGDIPLGNEKTMSTNLLKNRVLSLIDSDLPKAPLLKVLAVGMCDPEVKIIDQQGWKVVPGDQASDAPVISEKGETLVVNQHQLKELGLISQSLSYSEFKKLFDYSEKSEREEPHATTPPLEISSSVLMKKLKAHIKYHPQGTNTIGRIVIDDRQNGINQTTWIYVKSALDEYKETKPIFVILELNTPGGEVYAAQNISDALKELDTQYNIPVVCVINNWAISAGAMLAYSCRFIAVTKDASMGAAEPVIASETGEMKEASEKINSALRTDFANRAAFFDRNPYLAEAMVDKDMLVVLRNGRIIKLDNENQIKSTGLNPDVVISPKGKLLTLNSDELMRFGVADLLLSPMSVPGITPAEKEKGVWPADKERLFHADFFDQIPQATVVTHQMDWRTSFFAFLAHPLVSSLLFLGMLVGFYMEMSTPGVTLPGSIAAICLFLIILSSFAQEIGSMLELILLMVGLAAVLVELFVLPTFGLLGFAGLLFFLAGLFGLMLPGLGKVNFEWDSNTFNAAGEIFFQRLAWLCGTLILSLVIIWVLGKYVLHSFGAFKRFVLKGHEQDASLGYIAGEDPKLLPPPGTQGKVIATLRPAGKVILNDTIYDAMSEGNFIERGEAIEVVRIEGSIIIVNAIKVVREEQQE